MYSKYFCLSQAPLHHQLLAVWFWPDYLTTVHPLKFEIIGVIGYMESSYIKVNGTKQFSINASYFFFPSNDLNRINSVPYLRIICGLLHIKIYPEF